MRTNACGRNHWLALAATYGFTVSVVAMADWPWPLFVGGAFILIVVLRSVRYRQAVRKTQAGLAGPGPGAGAGAGAGAGVFGSLFGAGALLIRGTPAATWAGPLLGVIAFLGLFLYLQRFART
ncbi:hypothetical protein [Pseudarthrobacter scleromae]|uniref:hypothetical protein n=1 Tax=Pseudarthrobacter scleromae TaxID=158897 RepID=UPI003D0626A0